MTSEQLENLKTILDGTYLDKQDNETYTGEIYADYRDELDEGSIKKINNMEDFYEIFEFSSMEASDIEQTELLKIIRTEWDREEFGEYPEDDIQEWVSENVYFNFPYDHFLSQEINVNILVNTGDGNEDFTCNNLHELELNEISDNSSLLWLAEKQGYSKEILYKAITDQEYNGSKFLESVFEEVINTTTWMNALVFAVSMELKDYIEFLENKKDITISKDTSCGLVDFWNGAGGILEIQLEKSVTIPKEYIEIHIDGNRGYGIDEIYGISDSFWQNTIIA